MQFFNKNSIKEQLRVIRKNLITEEMDFARKSLMTDEKIEMYKAKYLKNSPYPHIEIDGLFKENMLTLVEQSFPDLSKKNKGYIKGGGELKISTREGCLLAKGASKHFLRYLNSFEFINFIQRVCNIERDLIADHTMLGGGLHSTGRGGSLGMHVDFPIHKKTKLDRRINVLVYLNKNWKEEWGGDFYATDEIETKKYAPTFNKTIIFETNDNTMHGHPYPLSCPKNRRRNSVAMYYYTNGRPEGQIKYPIWDENKGRERTTIFFPFKPV